MVKLTNSRMSGFIDAVGQKKIIAYGAGRNLRSACDALGDAFVKKLVAIVDEKGGDGLFFTYGMYKIPLVPLDGLRVDHAADIAILITPLVYYEIYETLTDCAKLDGADCYIFPIMREIAEPHGFPLAADTAQMKIPKKIHCIWFGRGEMSDLNKRCIESWRTYNPSYEIIMWNEDNYNLNRFPYTYSAYNAKRWALLVDFVRFDLLYEHGGIYVDTDVEMTASWDFLLYNDFFGFVQNNWFGMGNGFGAVAHHPILKKLMRPFLENDYTNIDVKKYSEKVIVDNYNLDKMREYGVDIWQNGQAINGGSNLFPQDMVILNTRYAQKTTNTIGIHHYERTWSSELKEKENQYTAFSKKYREELAIH